jgi:hypothetical protein
MGTFRLNRLQLTTKETCNGGSSKTKDSCAEGTAEDDNHCEILARLGAFVIFVFQLSSLSSYVKRV